MDNFYQLFNELLRHPLFFIGDLIEFHLDLSSVGVYPILISSDYDDFILLQKKKILYDLIKSSSHLNQEGNYVK